MQNDYWVIDVLRDIGDFANDRGYFRLLAAMEMARGEFLKDVEEFRPEGKPPGAVDLHDLAQLQTLVSLGKKFGH